MSAFSLLYFTELSRY